MSVELVKAQGAAQPGSCDPVEVSAEISKKDTEIFLRVVSTDLTPEQIERIENPELVLKRQDKVMACHWHPEFVPMEHNRARIKAMFPNADEELIIPTQHNQILSYGPFSGVEVDCYASGFNQKVQLLLHFESDRVKEAPVLKSMLAHTFKYRSSQLFSFMHAITVDGENGGGQCLEKAARETGADEGLINFVRVVVGKIEKLLDEHWEEVPEVSVKNKLLRNFFDELRGDYGHTFINRVQAFLKTVKKHVKANFSLKYFYRATEIIEEARALGGGVVIPHPEQFWPILLAEYDVDGIEVWNPQSQRYTEFLISAVVDKNTRRKGRRELLVFMGDDCHMGEKVKDPESQNKEKAAREIGYQPAWDDLSIRKQLIVANIDRHKLIEEYKARLLG